MDYVLYFRFPDPEYAEAFRAYSNYLVDISSEIGGSFGFNDSDLIEGVIDGVSLYLGGSGIQRRTLDQRTSEFLDASLRRSWAYLRRLRREVDDIESFDEESNAWLPVQAYYAVYNAIRAYAAASGQAPPRDHRKALNLAAKAVERDLLPYPWCMYCGGCPQTNSHFINGMSNVSRVHVLSAPHPDSAPDRLSMFLRTTRKKELDRRFKEARHQNVPTGRSRRNLTTAEKESIARRLHSTTVFDLFYRLRVKANYDDADTFVLGAAGVDDARAFALSLAILTDTTVAALEAVISAYVGPDLIGESAERYRDRIRAEPTSPVAIRASIFGGGDAAVIEPPF